jgi:predicted ABC-class ATPase
MATHQILHQTLQALDQQGYKAYRSLRGSYDFSDFTLWIDRVQADPFATPSQCRVQVPQAIAEFPAHLYCNRSREIALRDYLTRQMSQAMQASQKRHGTGNSGLIAMIAPAQQILERTAVLITEHFVEIRFVVGLPALGRRIAGELAVGMLCERIPELVASYLHYDQLNSTDLRAHIETAEDADCLRQQLPGLNLIAFIADGAVLPRQSGVDDRPLVDAVVFQSPDRLRVELSCPHQGRVTGMGIPAGVTLIVGGGFHGKSTLLDAIEQGIYNHIPGDGRERVVTHADAVKVRAEAGRSVVGVDISPFINHLPQGRSTIHFSTQNASGSTSQAASIIEALELGAQVLMMDEDTCATNLMIRDRRMQALIAQEPITPLVDKVRQLYTEFGVSSILVMGGSGDYFDVADVVIALDNFQPSDVTKQAKALAQKYPTARSHEGGERFGAITTRRLTPDSWGLERYDKPIKFQVRGLDAIVFDREVIDLRAVEQFVEMGQLRAIAFTLLWLQKQAVNQSLAETLQDALVYIETHGFDDLSLMPQADLATFRVFELAAALNRWRRLRVQDSDQMIQ